MYHIDVDITFPELILKELITDNNSKGLKQTRLQKKLFVYKSILSFLNNLPYFGFNQSLATTYNDLTS